MPAGSHFRYANNDTLLAARALRTDLGEAAETFPYTHLLWPLGMTRTGDSFERDIIGAHAAGLLPFWLNTTRQQAPRVDFPYKELHSLTEVL